MKFDICKVVCEGCGIVFNPDLLICRNCDSSRFRYCSLKEKFGVVDSVKHSVVSYSWGNKKEFVEKNMEVKKI